MSKTCFNCKRRAPIYTVENVVGKDLIDCYFHKYAVDLNDTCECWIQRRMEFDFP